MVTKKLASEFWKVLKKKFLFSALLDLVFLLLLPLGFYTVQKLLQSKIDPNQFSQLASSQVTTPEQLATLTPLFQQIYSVLLTLAISLVIYLSITYFLTRAVAHSYIQNRKIISITTFKSAAFPFIWALLLTLISVFMLTILSPAVAMVAALLLFFICFHTTTLLSIFLAKGQSIKSSLRKLHTTGIKKIHYFLLVYISFLVILLIIALLSYFINLISAPTAAAFDCLALLLKNSYRKTHREGIVWAPSKPTSSFCKEPQQLPGAPTTG